MKKIEIFLTESARAFDKPYHYEVPQELWALVEPGKRVLVPFGNSDKKKEAFITEVFDDEIQNNLKKILRVLDDEPLLSEEFIELAKWMKERYICTYGEAIRGMIPPGIGVKGSSVLRILNKDYHGTEKEDVIILRIKDNGGEFDYDDLRDLSKLKDFSKVVKALEKKKVLEIIESFQSKVKEKTIRVAYLIKGHQEILEEIESEKLKRIQQIRVLEMLIENEYIAVADIIRFAGVSAATVNTLKNRGYIEFGEVEVLRDPLKGDYEKTTALVPTEEQQKIIQYGINKLNNMEKAEILLHGVTGSGKTEVYLQLIENCIAQGKQSIVLVPEISLTPIMVKRFRGRFGEKVAIIHSRLSFGERYDQWRMIKDGRVSVAIGARSVVFAPFRNLALLIIDEEHEPSYKSEMKPKYHAIEIAKWRAKWNNAVLIQGSATPSMESYYKALNNSMELFELKNRTNKMEMPKVDIVDMRSELEAGNRSIFCAKLEAELIKNKDKKEQTILFINRRGYASFVLCRSCGHVVKCNYCNISMTYHQNHDRLICHYCGFTQKNPLICPRCSSKHIKSFGIGTQKVEEDIRKHFEGIGVIRMDLDTTSRKNAHEKILKEFEEKNIDILVGTQMIAKGHDFPNVTLVGIMAADSMLNTGDIRAPERTFQLLTQSAGRAGRAQKTGRVIIQAYNIDHYSITCAARHDYHAFYESEIKLRKDMDYPPFTNLAVIILSGVNDKQTNGNANEVLDYMKEWVLKNEKNDMVKIIGPARAPLSKIKGKYRWRLVLKSKDEQLLVNLITVTSDNYFKNKKDKSVDFSMDINPINMS